MTGTGTSRALARTTPQPLTAGDRAALAKYGRPTLMRRLRVQVAAGWTTLSATLLVGFPMIMSDDYASQDTGLVLTLLTIPSMLVAAHGQARLTRLRADDPAVSLVAAVPEARQTPELTELGELRGRLTELTAAMDARYRDVAQAMRTADERAHRSLEQQARALALLPESDDDATAAARSEIRDRLRAGITQYQQLIAQAALLLARADAHTEVDAPLQAAADLAATYSEGIRVSEESGS